MDEGVVTVPLIDTEVGIKLVQHRVPGDLLPAHAHLQPRDIRLRRMRGISEGHVASVKVRQMGGDLVGDEQPTQA
jgi:hypothetical protein